MPGDNSKITNPGGMNKPYRTNSILLLQVQEREGISREVIELQTIIESVHNTLGKVVSPNGDIVSLEFLPKGCSWRMELNSALNDADQNYWLEVTAYANEVQGVTNYMVDTMLKLKGEYDPNPMAPPLKGYREAKQTFDFLALQVRKSIVRLEFPEFPEGCKGKPFREVYQLNARVSRYSYIQIRSERKWTRSSNSLSFDTTAQVRVFCHRLSWYTPSNR